MTQTIAIWLPRVLGVIASGIAGKAAEHGISVDPATVTGLMLAVYAGVHRLASKHLNPGDSAKSVLIKEEKATVAASE